MIDLYDVTFDLDDVKAAQAREDRTVRLDPDEFFLDLLMEQEEQK